MLLATLELEKLAYTFRLQILKLAMEVESVHLGGSFSVVDLLTVLYFGNIASINPTKPEWPGRDRILLSAGHYAPALYCVLAKLGWITLQDAAHSDSLGGVVQAHPVRNISQGIEIAAGALGQGLSVAVGMATAMKLSEKQERVICVTSDGEHQEGQTWEAIMWAGGAKLRHLIAIVDHNKIQIGQKCSKICSLGNLARRYRAFGWQVVELDGHNFEEMTSVLAKIRSSEQRRPVAVIAHTIAGKGVKFMEGKPAWHHKTPTQREYEMGKEELVNNLKTQTTKGKITFGAWFL